MTLERLLKRFSVLVLGTALCLLMAGAGPAAKQPKIAFDRVSHDFGKAKQGETLGYEFVFRNKGDAPLTIANVETSCGCTAALVTDKRLEPGKDGKIKISFNTAGYGGPVSKFIYVDSDDPDKPRVQLTVSADVEVPPQPRIDLQPYTADVGLLLQNESARGRVVIRNLGELELVVDCSQKNVDYSSGGAPVTFPLKIAAGKETSVDVKLSLPNRVGLLREYIVFRSNDVQRPALSFSLTGYIVTKAQLKDLFTKYKDALK